MATNLRLSWTEKAAREAQDEEEELRWSQAEMGAAHREADNLLRVQAATSTNQSRALLETAMKRGDRALHQLKGKKMEVEKEEERKTRHREKAKEIEKERAKRIAALPPPGYSICI